MILHYLSKLSGKSLEKRKSIMEESRFLLLANQLEKALLPPDNHIKVFFPEEAELVKGIRQTVHNLNRNNMTRTRAYLDYYGRNTEVDWAFLAHMVSRNGGYHMTDLKGSSMTNLLNEKDQKAFFLFLERANAAIFADAFPQLLLYEHTKKKTIPLRELLEAFHVSRFMAPIWETFLETLNPALLTAGLIINEQRMIQERVIKRSQFGNILKRIDFQLQELLGFTSVIFPYTNRNGKTVLPGLTIEHFAEPDSRIETGKKLYRLLFDDPIIKKAVLRFAESVPHTGSREDYWPTVHTQNSSNPNNKIYSPTVQAAWKDHALFPFSPADWFTDRRYIKDLQSLPPVKRIDMSGKVLEHAKALQVLNEIKSFI